jgi:hypothetical protein
MSNGTNKFRGGSSEFTIENAAGALKALWMALL